MELIVNHKSYSQEESSKTAVVLLAAAVINAGAYLFRIITTALSFRYPHVFSIHELLLLSFCYLLPSIVALTLFFLMKGIELWIRLGSIVISIVLASVSTFHVLCAGSNSLPLGSETQDSLRYLELDQLVSDDYRYNYFPETIPESATNVQYMYRFSPGYSRVCEIYLKITLPKDAFDAERVRIQRQYPDVTIIERSSYATIWGIPLNDTLAIYQFRAQANPGEYHYELVAFSEPDMTVTYVMSAAKYNHGNVITPYFKEVAPGVYD